MSDMIHYVDDAISLPVLLRKIKAYFVPKTRTINGKPLGEDIMLLPEDIQCCKITKKTASLASGSWSSKQQQVNVAGVTADNVVIVSPQPGSYLNYHKYKVRCTAQAAGKLTFTTDGAPPALTVDVLILDNTQ